MNEKQERRKKRVRAKISGTARRPRLSVFRSSRAIYAQVIDDDGGKTILAARDTSLSKTDSTKETKTEKAKRVGQVLGEQAIKKNIKTMVFDRNRYKYHGRIKALAEGVRQAGVKI